MLTFHTFYVVNGFGFDKESLIVEAFLKKEMQVSKKLDTSAMGK